MQPKKKKRETVNKFGSHAGQGCYTDRQDHRYHHGIGHHDNHHQDHDDHHHQDHDESWFPRRAGMLHRPVRTQP